MKHTMAFLVLNIILQFFTVSGLAHEGHDHDSPKGINAPKGGVLKALEQTYVEVVSKGPDIKIYLYDKDLKPQDVASYTVTAQAQKPRTKTTEVVEITAHGSFLEASFDAKGIHRYTLILRVKDPKTKHDDQLKFTIEPRK